MEIQYKVEYVWLDGYTPEPNLRSKTKIITKEIPTRPWEEVVADDAFEERMNWD